jgi:putative phosphotransacetylase
LSSPVEIDRIRGATVLGTAERADVERVVRDVVLHHLRPRDEARTPPSPLVVNVSARHMHVCRADLDRLFGPGHELTPLRPLYQEGHFAAEETVSLVGPKRRLISNLRILGPLRRESQIELAFSDAVALGLEDVPIRLSGDIKGSAGGYVLGPNGMVEMKEGIIRAALHVHMGPADAAFYGVRHKDMMRLRVGGPAGLVFESVLVRVDPSFRLEVHLDTDEANACGLHLTKDVELLKA